MMQMQAEQGHLCLSIRSTVLVLHGNDELRQTKLPPPPGSHALL